MEGENSSIALHQPVVAVNEFSGRLVTTEQNVRWGENEFATVLLCAIFIPVGIVNTMLGPMLPLLSKQWALTDVQAGYLFSSQFVGSIAGVILSGKLVSRRGFRPVVLAGLVLMAFGVAALTAGSVRWGLAAIFLYGAGLGLTIPTINLLVARINSSRSAVALNYLNLFWGLGAVTCPFLIALCQHRYRAVTPMQYGLTFVLSMFAVGVMAVKTSGYELSVGSRGILEGGAILRGNKLFLVLAALFFVYVATENGVTGWIASLAQRAEVSREIFWTMVPGFFWSALLLGRAVGHFLLRLVSELNAVRIHLLVALAGIVGLMAAPNLEVIIAGSIAAGLGLSTVFPLYIDLLSKNFGVNAPRVGGLLFACAGLGGACGPLLVGFTAEHFSLRIGFLFPLAGCAAMLALSAPQRKWWNKSRQDVYSRAN